MTPKTKAFAGVSAVIAALALLLTNIEKIIDVSKRGINWLTHREDQPPKTIDETPVGPIRVLSIEASRSDGRYFCFDAATLDQFLGRQDWNARMYMVSKHRETVFTRAVLWRRDNLRIGSAVGRFLPEGKPGAWKEGESFYVIPKDLGPWNEKEQ